MSSPAPRRSGRSRAETTPQQPTAGPSTPTRSLRKTPVSNGQASSARPSRIVDTHDSSSSGNGPALGSSPIVQPGQARRVVPARIRRAAGGGQEGIRDLEEMIVDWLERYGLPSDSPPDTLPIHLTSLPLSLVYPPTYETTSLHAQPMITLTPTSKNRMPTPSPRRADFVMELEPAEKIETPGWILVRPGEDDAEEAREEVSGGGGRTSPLKRLRRLTMDENAEDTSDSYYVNLHRKYEVFERRQRIREREKLVFERYKMRSRIDLLKNMSSASWSTVVSTVLSRGGDKTWTKGREKVGEMGPDWLRSRLVREGRELVRRYDQLLPVEPRKNRTDRALSASTTPDRHMSSSPAPSSSPPPVVLPARVSALRDPNSQKRPKHLPTPNKETPTKSPRRRLAPRQEYGMEADDPAILLPRKRKRHPMEMSHPPNPSNLDLPAAETAPGSTVPRHESLEDVKPDMDGADILTPPPPEASSPENSLSPFHNASPSSSRSSSPMDLYAYSRKIFYPPMTASGLPCLIDAANRRESEAEEALAAQARVQARQEGLKEGKKVSRFIAREKTRTSGRLGLGSPFGLPFPAVLEQRADFSITQHEAFWKIITEREARAGLERQKSNGPLGLKAPLSSTTIPSATASRPAKSSMTKEDVADMKEVEAAVVL